MRTTMNLRRPTSYINPVSLRGVGVFALGLASLITGGLFGIFSNVVVYFVGLIGVLGYVFLCFGRPFIAFAILVFSALTVWLSGLKIAGGISAMIGLGLIFSTFWLARIMLRTTVFRVVKEYKFLLALVVVVFITLLFHLDGPAGFSAVSTYLQLFLLFVLVINLTTTASRLHGLAGVMILSSALLATLILFDNFGWLPSELIPEQTVRLAEGSHVMVSRTAGLWGDANFTALQLTIALPFIIEWWPAAGRLKQALLVIAGGAILVTFAWTFSMGGLLGLAVMVLVKMTIVSRRDRLFVIARNLLIGLIVFSSLLLIAPDLFIQRILTNFQITVSALATLDRASLLAVGTDRGDTWWAAIQAIAASPLLGYGPGNAVFANATYSSLQIKAWLSPHNMFLAVAGDLGLFGLALFGTLFFLALKVVRPPANTPVVESTLHRDGRAIYIALIGYAAQGMALEIHNLKLLWILMGMAIAYRQISMHFSHAPKLIINHNG